MKIALVMPCIGNKPGSSYIKSWKMEPLALATLAGMTPSDVEIVLYDDRLERIPYEDPVDLVGITVETYTAKRAYHIASKFRARNISVVLGGYHVTLMPEEASEHATAIVVGEAEGIWPQVIEDARKKKLKKKYITRKLTDLSGIKPDHSIYKGKKYQSINLIEFSRGCRHACNFCSITAFHQQNHICRPVKDVVCEIKFCRKDRPFFFVDDNIASNISEAKTLFQKLIPLNIKWVGQFSISAAQDDELLDLMKKSGCIGMLVGFESLNEKNLRQMQKSWNTGAKYYNEMLKKIRKRGLKLYTTFLLGYDYDNQDVINQTVNFAVLHKFFIAAFNHLVPFPGTPLYHEFEKCGRLLYDKWWLHPDFRFGDIVFKPKQMTPEEMIKHCMEARRRFYRLSSIAKRAFDFRTNVNSLNYAFLFLALNLQFQKEVEKKIGIELGRGSEKN